MGESEGARRCDRPWWCSRFVRGALLLTVAGSNAQGFLMARNAASFFAATSGRHRTASAWKSLQPSATRITESRQKALSAVAVGKEIGPVYGGEKTAAEVVVVGAGVGGLATAARLAKAGCRVTVVEKNSEEDIGGRLNELVMEGGFRFDTGPSLLLLPETYRETFAELGRDSDEFFEMRRVSPTYKVYFDDGESVDLSDDEEDLRRQMDRLEDGGFDKYKAYLDGAQLNLEVGLPNFIEEKFTPGRLPEFALGALFNSPLENHYGQLSRRFDNPKMRALLSFQDLYVGLSPYNAPAVFSLLQAIELRDGVYYPTGGFARVGEALGTVCRDLGVKFRFDSPVSEVSVVGEGGRVNSKGVVLASGELLEADAVVCNADLPYAEKALLPDSVSRSFENSEYSTSVIAFYLCSNRRWPQLSHHTVFLSTDWKASWDSAFGKLPGGELGESFNFYAAAPARTDPSVCPEGSDAIMVLVPCPSIPDDYTGKIDDGGSGNDTREGGGPDREDWVRRAREGVIREMEASAGMEGFGDSIVGEEVYAPWNWRDRYNLRRGAVFGLSHGLNQLSLLRPGPQHPTVNGLWFCGASSRPGNGVPLVLIGAKQVAANVLKVVEGGNT
ncbi:conserved unknown protein [Ectocarpus siliculosus]|uniref:Amine oxidase domain-containing protein n=1 Tax=Ectocarpus siliculosus TaxID=2880 RepID=D7FLI6_ECTSI|nr:conserved unknown protein [Ectocarpus siliculosus]|eukprot:CBJ25802.1 conserved unknown protein [Ectocarpus siliculosus]